MRRTKAEAEETRQAILAAAERVFFKKGVANSSLDEVAVAAGVTRGAIYWHFSSKTDLFIGLYKSVALPESDLLDFDDPDLKGLTLLAKIEEAACKWLALLAQDEQRQRIMTISLRTSYSDEFAPVLHAQEELDRYHKDRLEAAFERAQAEGAFNDNWTAESALGALYWLLKGICSDWLLFGKRFDLAKDGGKAVHSLMKGFRRAANP
ncbi:TetR family transcriptional regulator [Agrobacterium genomosp. 3]|uniref:TetR family transcriptional regulator n=1 Tax=Agrobacterium tumefaciens TaxID=358 RepID=A0AAE6BQZ4_AGRTU|nr:MULTISPECIES: TetR family transcriptional regulator [Agrobacterium]MCA1869147.1 TetR family transcriptional regulator [Agrobacterium tomkonis]MCA1879504.1 TetR family transcriptional regulator [Agrobacterium tumefaciens]MCA1894722.1 TetR family transcriptional regulator [Agrobacterium tomkonis]MCA2372588.1 TetR family transcriptional regulator [Agrobacterium tomkonis CIP 111-78]MCD4659757.1 TetR family transcriptional regulator [Agrobacterium sp.]